MPRLGVWRAQSAGDGTLALRLLPFAGTQEAMPEPEYALPEGNVMYYSMAR